MPELKVRSKILIILAAAILLFTGIFFFISHTVLLESLASMEESYAYEHLLRVGHAFQEKVDYLARLTADWGSWNDSYDFILDMNENYIRTNIVDSTFRELQINFMVFINLKGRIVHSYCFDFHSDAGAVCSEDFAQTVAASWFEVFGGDFDKMGSGVIALPTGDAITACHPILQSDDSGPARGRLVMGRALDGFLVEKIAKSVHLPLSLHSLDSPRVRSAQEVSGKRGTGASVPMVGQLDKESIAGYYTLTDIQNKHVAAIEMLLPRHLYAKGERALFHYVLWLLGTGVMVIAILFFLLDRFIVARLTRLLETVRSVKGTEDLCGLITLEGSDEIAGLEREINAMGARLRAAHSILQAQEERLRQTSFKLLNAQEAERRRLSRELHDEFGQILSLLKMRVKYLGKSIQNLTETQKRELLNEIPVTIDKLINEVRLLSKDLSPSAVDDLGLWTSIEGLAKRYQNFFDVVIDIADSAKRVLFPSDKGIAVFRIVQEALSNAAKHSEAGRVVIEVFVSSGCLVVRIEDNGSGFDLLLHRTKGYMDKGMGLSIMAQRAQMLGGNLSILAGLGTGTCLTLSIPLSDEEAVADE
jgi:adenylate cyclase